MFGSRRARAPTDVALFQPGGALRAHQQSLWRLDDTSRNTHSDQAKAAMVAASLKAVGFDCLVTARRGEARSRGAIPDSGFCRIGRIEAGAARSLSSRRSVRHSTVSAKFRISLLRVAARSLLSRAPCPPSAASVQRSAIGARSRDQMQGDRLTLPFSTSTSWRPRVAGRGRGCIPS